MKRRLLSAFLAVMMVLTMAPVAFAADGGEAGSSSAASSTVVAKIGDAEYSTLQEAVDAANNGDTVILVENTNEGFTVPASLSIIFDVNGKTLEKTGQDIQNNGTLIIRDNTKQGKIIANGGNVGIAIGVGNDSVTTIEYANVEAVEGAVITGQATGATITIKDGVFSTSDNAVIAGNGTKREGNANEITINGGIFNGKIQSSGYVACGIYAPWRDDITVNGGTFNIEKGAGIVARAGNVTVNGGEFNTTGNVTGKVGDSRVVVPCAALVFDSEANYPAMNDASKIEVKTGKFKSDVAAVTVIKQALDAGNRVEVSGGLFSSDVSEYCADGLTALNNDNATYKYKVDKISTESAGKIKAEADKTVETKPTVADDIKTEDKSAADAVAANTTVKLDASDVTEEDKMAALDKLKGTDAMVNGNIAEGKNVTVEKETYLDVKVEKCEIAGKTPETYLVSMDITPRYNLTLKVEGENSGGSTTLKQGEELKNVGKTDVSVTLPTQFASRKVYITHKGKSVTEYLTANATDTGVVNFTVNGFSPITFTLVPDSAVVAEVNGNTYTSLQDAANAAKDGDEIAVVKNDKLDLIFNTTKSVKVTNKTNDKITVKFNGTDKEIDKDHTETFSYTKPSSSGGSSSGKTTFKVTTSAVNNGGVNASPSNAEKGATITITLSPDKGYKLDKLTVTDGSGKTVSTVKKSDTVYTCTMPASAVKVGVSYVKATETPSETKFNDVSANDWFASAVDYVTGKGMMNGTADNTFSPKANTTRGMVVTVLYRLENQPSTSAASFTDVASGAYYANAVAWANANGIVSGYGSGKFGPNDKVTREQLAAILYRYAQYKKYDVSVGEDTNILSYDDAQSISSYAIPAIQWACGAGVVTGKSGSKLDPKGNATRAEVAAMLMRFCENVK